MTMSTGKTRSGRGESLYSEQTGRFVRLLLEQPKDALAEYGFNFIYSIDESDSASFLKEVGIAADTWRQKFLETVAVHRRGKLDEAEKRYKSLLEDDSSHKEIEYNLAALYLQKGDADQAVKHLDKFERFVSSVKDDDVDKAVIDDFKQRITELREEIAQA